MFIHVYDRDVKETVLGIEKADMSVMVVDSGGVEFMWIAVEAGKINTVMLDSRKATVFSLSLKP